MPTISAVVDTNVVLRQLLGDIPDQSIRANRLFSDAMRGDTHIYVPSTVFFEAAYVLTKSKGVAIADTAAALRTLLGFRGLHTDHPAALADTLDFWRKQGPLSFADCFHICLAEHLEVGRILTYDRKMDRYPGVTRIEP